VYNAGLLALRLAVTDSTHRDAHLAEARDRYREALLLRPGDAASKWNLELAIRRTPQGTGGGQAPSGSGGGGGGKGGGAQAPTPPPPARGLSRAQAEQILNSIANEERQVREALAKRGPPQEVKGGKNW